MRLNGSSLLLPALWVATAQALTAAQWSGQSVYQILTDRFARTDGSTTASCDLNSYCGGTWQGIINKLDYIQGMGFTAIWISPIVANIQGNSVDGTSYHGFWAEDITAVNSAFGTEADLIALSAALHARNMYLMVDVVNNHMGYLGCGTCVDYSKYTVFNQQSYYHPYCETDYSNLTSIQVCWEGDNTVSLPDLRTENSDVRTMWYSWIKGIVAKYSIDGLRMDSAEHVEKSFWPGWGTASGVYNVGEVYEGDPSIFPDWLNYIDGTLNYPAFFWITQAFQSTSGSISNLVNGINTLKGSMKTSTFGSFLENHDQPRFPSLTGDTALAKNAIAFTMLADGIPIIYYGQEQSYAGGGVPNDREALWTSGYSTTSAAYTFIATINRLRSSAVAKDAAYVAYQAYPVYSDAHTVAMKKSSVVGVFSNIGSGGGGYAVALPAGTFAAAQALTEVVGCRAYAADSAGGLTFTIGQAPSVLYPTASLSGSGLCGDAGGAGSGGSSTATTAISTTTATGGGSATSPACASVPVKFNEIATTNVGETIKISGSVPALGSWDTSKAVALSATSYTSSNHLWSATIDFAPGAVISYKYINVASSGAVSWEADPNHTYTVPTSCATAAVVANTWQ